MAWREDAVIRRLRGVDGGAGSPQFPSYLLAAVPDAALWLGQAIIVSDATPPALCWSDGTDWIASDDGTAVA